MLELNKTPTILKKNMATIRFLVLFSVLFLYLLLLKIILKILSIKNGGMI
jgi:hypothetical protein